jgi:hypothetical protein
VEPHNQQTELLETAVVILCFQLLPLLVEVVAVLFLITAAKVKTAVLAVVVAENQLLQQEALVIRQALRHHKVTMVELAQTHLLKRLVAVEQAQQEVQLLAPLVVMVAQEVHRQLLVLA